MEYFAMLEDAVQVYAVKITSDNKVVGIFNDKDYSDVFDSEESRVIAELNDRGELVEGYPDCMGVAGKQWFAAQS